MVYHLLLRSQYRLFGMPDMACKIFTSGRTTDLREETRQIWTRTHVFGKSRECHPLNPCGISYLPSCQLQSSLLPYESQSGLPQQVSVNLDETAPSLAQFWPMLQTRAHEFLWRSQERIGFRIARNPHRASQLADTHAYRLLMGKLPLTRTTLTGSWTLPHNGSQLAYNLLEVDRWIRCNAYAGWL